MEENAKKFNLNKKTLLMIGGAVALVLVVVLIALMLPGNINTELTLEAGRNSISANDFRKEDKGVDAQFISDMTAVDLDTVGVYPVKIQYKNKTYDCTVKVEDTIAPEAVVQNLAIYSNQTLTAEDFVVSVSDASAVAAAVRKLSNRSRCRMLKLKKSSCRKKRPVMLITGLSSNANRKLPWKAAMKTNFHWVIKPMIICS